MKRRKELELENSRLKRIVASDQRLGIAIPIALDRLPHRARDLVRRQRLKLLPLGQSPVSAMPGIACPSG